MKHNRVTPVFLLRRVINFPGNIFRKTFTVAIDTTLKLFARNQLSKSPKLRAAQTNP